jgi:hypothetical protein
MVYCHQSLGFSMGTEKPMVFPKWVLWVQVQYWILAHCSIPCTHTAVSQVFTSRLSSTGEPCINFLLLFISAFLVHVTIKQFQSHSHISLFFLHHPHSKVSQIFLLFKLIICILGTNNDQSIYKKKGRCVY